MKAGNEMPEAAYKPLPQAPPPSEPLLADETDAADPHDLDLQHRHHHHQQRQNLAYRSDSPSPSPYVDDPKVGRSFEPLEMAAELSFGGGPGGVEADLGNPTPVKEERKGDKIGLYVTLASLATLTIGTWILVLSNNPSKLGLFAAHPPLQTLAITCFGLGILLLQPTSQPKTKARGLTRHQLVILGIGLPSIVIGTGLVYANKVIHESDHFTTWHATFGLIAFVWMTGQMLLGGLSVWFGGRAFGGGMKAKSVWKYHRASGYLLFPMFLMTAAVGGNYSSWASSVASVGVRVLLYTLAPIFALVGLWSRMRTSKMNFRQ